MNRLNNLSIKNKLLLIILITVIVSVSLLVFTFTYQDIKGFKRELVTVSKVLAKVAATNLAPALTFNDATGAREVLNSLKSFPTIEYACVHDTNDIQLTTYGNQKMQVEFEFPESQTNIHFTPDYLLIKEDAFFKEVKYGHIHLFVSTSELNQTISAHVKIMSVFAGMAILVAYLIALKLQGYISDPILRLANVTDKISRSADYSERVYKKGNDELGLLYDGFNRMLGQLQLRQLQNEEAESALREQEERYRLLFESSGNANFLCELYEKELRFIDCNSKACEIFKADRSALLNKKPSELSPKFQPDGQSSDVAASEKIHAAVNGEPQHFYWKHCHVDKTPFDAEVTLNKLALKNKTYIQAIVRDITKRKKAENALRESEQRFRHLFENAPVSLWEEDIGELLLYLQKLKNRGVKNFQLYFEQYPEEISNCTQRIKITNVNKAAIELFNAKDRNDLIKNLDKTFSQRARQTLIGELITLTEGRSFFSETTELKTLDGKDLHIDLRFIVQTLEQDDGKSTSALLAMSNISELKKASDQIKKQNTLLQNAVQETTRQMEKLMDKMIRQEKLATIGKVSGSIAHELRNPLGAIRQSVFFLTRKLPDAPEKVQRHLALIDGELAIAGKVIDDLLEITREKLITKEKIKLDNLIDETVARCQLEKDIEFIKELPADDFVITADPVQMQQVIFNLITNSRQALRNKGTITLKAQKNKKSKTVSIIIADDGPGMNEEALENAFEPLFTTKAKGTGLGLSICKQIVENHAGKIKLQTGPGMGVTATITLPDENGATT